MRIANYLVQDYLVDKNDKNIIYANNTIKNEDYQVQIKTLNQNEKIRQSIADIPRFGVQGKNSNITAADRMIRKGGDGEFAYVPASQIHKRKQKELVRNKYNESMTSLISNIRKMNELLPSKYSYGPKPTAGEQPNHKTIDTNDDQYERNMLNSQLLDQ